MFALTRPTCRLIALVALAAAISGCSGAGGAASTGGATGPPPPPVVPRVPVPYVLGERPAKAVADLQAVGFVGVVQGNPPQPELCRVSDQDLTGAAEKGATVMLRLRCEVRVPNVVGQATADAQARIESVGGLSVVFSYKPDSPTDCTVAAQDAEGLVKRGTSVLLTVKCPLTLSTVRRNAVGLARQSARSDGSDYTLGNCTLVSEDEGDCEVTYNTPATGVHCVGTIMVSKTSEDMTHAEQPDIKCY